MFIQDPGSRFFLSRIPYLLWFWIRRKEKEEGNKKNLSYLFCSHKFHKCRNLSQLSGIKDLRSGIRKSLYRTRIPSKKHQILDPGSATLILTKRTDCFSAVLRIRIRRIHKFLSLLDPDPLDRATIRILLSSSKNSKKNLDPPILWLLFGFYLLKIM